MSKFNQRLRTLAVPGVAGVFLSFCIAVAFPVWAHLGTDKQIALLNEQIVAQPDDATLYLRRGELHRIHEDWAAAEADYRHAKTLDSEATKLHFLLGQLKLDAGEFNAAHAHLNRFLTKFPEHVPALVARARAREAMGRHLAAAGDFTKLLELTDTALPTYYLERARAIEGADPKWLERAVSGLDEGLERLGEPVTLQLLAIDLELKLERHDAAIARLEKIAAKSARKESWTIRKAEILESAGRPSEALSTFQQTLTEINSLNSNHRGSRAVQKLEGRALEAIARLEKATTPTDSEQSP
jgi:tetratricopeptide (TPR) repeat protein